MAQHGHADNARHRYFDLICAGQQANDLENQQQAAIEADTTVLAGLQLSSNPGLS